MYVFIEREIWLAKAKSASGTSQLRDYAALNNIKMGILIYHVEIHSLSPRKKKVDFA